MPQSGATGGPCRGRWRYERVIVVSAPDPRTGRDRVNVVGTIDGGGGARRGVDGLDGSEVRYSQRSVPVEVIEIETVLVMRALRLVPDSRRAESSSAAPRSKSKWKTRQIARL